MREMITVMRLHLSSIFEAAKGAGRQLVKADKISDEFLFLEEVGKKLMPEEEYKKAVNLSQHQLHHSYLLNCADKSAMHHRN